jgi:hypothetical protein
MNDVLIRETTDDDRTAVLAFLRELWGGEEMVVHDEVVRPAELRDMSRWTGATCSAWRPSASRPTPSNSSCLDSLARARPSRRAADRGEREAASRGCASLWLVTTNDNLVALRFYQSAATDRPRRRRGQPRPHTARPAIPSSDDGIPIRDELVLEKSLPGWARRRPDEHHHEPSRPRRRPGVGAGAPGGLYAKRDIALVRGEGRTSTTATASAT